MITPFFLNFFDELATLKLAIFGSSFNDKYLCISICLNSYATIDVAYVLLIKEMILILAIKRTQGVCDGINKSN